MTFAILVFEVNMKPEKKMFLFCCIYYKDLIWFDFISNLALCAFAASSLDVSTDVSAADCVLNVCVCLYRLRVYVSDVMQFDVFRVGTTMRTTEGGGHVTLLPWRSCCRAIGGTLVGCRLKTLSSASQRLCIFSTEKLLQRQEIQRLCYFRLNLKLRVRANL